MVVESRVGLLVAVPTTETTTTHFGVCVDRPSTERTVTRANELENVVNKLPRAHGGCLGGRRR